MKLRLLKTPEISHSVFMKLKGTGMESFIYFGSHLHVILTMSHSELKSFTAK